MFIMLGAITLLKVSGLINDLFAKLTGSDGQMWLGAFKKFLRKENPWVVQLLKTLETVSLPAVAEFVVASHFKVNVSDGAEVKISYLDDDFARIFGGRTEKKIPATTLRINELLKNSLDAPILDELGDCKETMLAHLWELLKRQPNGEKGLLTRSTTNIFYVRDASCTLWAVRASWISGDWHVGVSSVTSSIQWDADDCVFSC